MSAEPTAWEKPEDVQTEWYQESAEFALYDTNKSYNADIPYDLDVMVKTSVWDEVNSIATQWSPV